jgi:hypothetical protein
MCFAQSEKQGKLGSIQQAFPNAFLQLSGEFGLSVIADKGNQQ